MTATGSDPFLAPLFLSVGVRNSHLPEVDLAGVLPRFWGYSSDDGLRIVWLCKPEVAGFEPGRLHSILHRRRRSGTTRTEKQLAGLTVSERSPNMADRRGLQYRDFSQNCRQRPFFDNLVDLRVAS